MRQFFVTLVATLTFLAFSITAVANGPAIHFGPGDVPDDVFPAPNGCTGALTTFTAVHESLVLHETLDAQGGSHVTGTEHGTITSTDGFSGNFTAWFGGSGGGNGAIVGQFTATVILTNADGDRLKVQIVEAFTLVGGEAKAEVSRFSSKCIGSGS